jgi:hypothetical protein
MIKRILLLLLDYWYVPVLFLAGVLAVVFLRKPFGLSMANLDGELAAIRAGRDAREVKEREGAEAARQKVLADHWAAMDNLDEKQRAEAEELKDDPEALARFLVRAYR